MIHRHTNLIILTAVLLCADTSTLSAEVIESREFRYQTRVRATTFAAEGVTITCPLSWPQLLYVVPDGTYVEKGTKITEFGREGIDQALDEQRRRGVEARAGLAAKLAELRNRKLDLVDELALLEDQLDFLQTRLQRYQALPDADDVAIAAGQLAVARLEYEAAERDFATAKDRFQRERISPAERDKYERRYLEARARFRHREAMHELASRQATSALLGRTELAIANIRLEIDKTKHEISEHERLAEIERQGAVARVEISERRIEEREEDLEKTVVKAPISGYVVYLPMFRRHAHRTGEKMWRGFAYLRIPDQDTMALKGTVPESQRRYFEAGDTVEIRVVGHTSEPLQGRIASFSAVPHDRGEKDQEGWPRESDSGIMVYDVTVSLPDERPDWLRVGMSAECLMTASRPLVGPAVPAAYVRTRNGEHYLSFDGVYRQVEGIMVAGYFLLSDSSLEGRDAAWTGRFPEQLPTASSGAAAEDSASFGITGELVPADTADVTVGAIHGWQKVAWLIPEDTEVEAGTVVARLEVADTDEAIKEQETELKRATSRRETEAEEIKMRTRENRFALDRARNLLAVAELELEETRKPEPTVALLNARLSVELARIRLEFLDRHLRRVEAMKRTALSPLEVAELQRDRQRAELQHEAANIRLAELARGPDEDEICRAELAVLERQLDVSTLETKLETDAARNNYGLRRAERDERRQQERLDDLKQRRENLVLKAPRPGLVRYSRIFSSAVWAKVDVGSQVGQHVTLMTIADRRRMYVELEMPERFFTEVRKGMKVEVRTPSLSDAALTGRVTEVEFLFRRKRRKDTERGLYSSHEELGETVFLVRVEVDEQQGLTLKPGAVAEVVFPFPKWTANRGTN